MSAQSRGLLTSSFFVWVAFGLVAAYFIFPLRKNLKYGIDLVGGTYITLEVQTNKAIDDELQNRMRIFLDSFKEAEVAAPIKHSVQAQKLSLTFDSAQALNDALSYLKKDELARGLEQSVENKTVTLAFSSSEQERIAQWAVESNIAVLDSRLRKMAVEEIAIGQQGKNRIYVELPDVQDPQQAKAMIGTPAILEFKIVEKIASNEDDILDDFDGQLPDDMMILPGRREEHGRMYYLVSTYADITGKLLKDAKADLGGQRNQQPVVIFEFTPEGGRQFYELTSKNVGQPLGIVLDGIVISAPRINEAIGRVGNISGNFTYQEVKELASFLKSGAFVAPVTFEEERRIGPTLGEESIKRGLMSCLIGLFLLFIFSLYYYRTAGLLAFIALLYNLLILLFILSQFKATLTLPGIAGMVLTVGMAIDASVLIYEKIKEEIEAGKSYRNAVQSGFSDAMVVILDANITTFIVGAVLFKFGTGPIQGFAVTMMIGIVTTLITGLFFLRSLFSFVLDYVGVQRIKI